MAKVGTYTREEIVEAMSSVTGVAAKTMALDLAARLNLSVGHVYRIAAAARQATRKTRKDAGARRVALDPEVVKFMERLSLQDLSAAHVLFLTARHFSLAEDFCSVTTYNQMLRRQRMGRRDLQRDLRPYRAFEAAKPNDMHHYDTTVAEAYYVNDDGSIGREDGAVRYKNKPGNRRPRLILYSLVDDHSRVIFARFYVHENTLNLLDFVKEAWQQKADKRFPFFGIPTSFYADKGSQQRSPKFLHAMQVLDVKVLDSTPSHSEPFGSRKHGKIERTFGEGLLGELMKLTKFYRFESIEVLNTTLWDWLIWVNNRKHSMTKEVRFQRWLRLVGTPRSMPAEELSKLLHWDHTERTVSRNLQISLNGKTFQLPYRKPFINWVEVKVQVYWYPGQDDTIIVAYDRTEEELQALAPVVDLALEYKQAPRPDREARIAALQETPITGINIPEIYRTDLPYLPKKGAKFDETRITATAKVVEHDDGSTRPSFVGNLYLNRYEVVNELAEAGLMEQNDAGKYTEASLQLRDLCMAGRDTVSDDHVKLFIRDCQNRTRNVA